MIEKQKIVIGLERWNYVQKGGKEVINRKDTDMKTVKWVGKEKR